MQIIPVEIENVEIECRMGSVLIIDTKNSLYVRRRLETCVHDPISKRWAIHFQAHRGLRAQDSGKRDLLWVALAPRAQKWKMAIFKSAGFDA